MVKKQSLYEEGDRLSFSEAFLVLLSVAVGIGYISINSFYIKTPSFYDVPIVTCVLNALFGIFSIYLLLDAKHLEQKLGSF